MMISYSEAKFIAEATMIAGGYSYRPFTLTPRTGYMVGGIVPEGIASPSNLTENVFTFAMAWQSYMRDSERRFIGTWVNRETGKIHLDISEHHETLDSALMIAEVRGELAVYEIATQKEIRLPKREKA